LDALVAEEDGVVGLEEVSRCYHEGVDWSSTGIVLVKTRRIFLNPEALSV